MSRLSVLSDGIRLSVGTLTILRTGAVTVGPASARAAMIIAPLAVLPLAVAAGLIGYVGWLAGLPSLATALLMIAAVALGSRALHLDGLADTTDGFGASWDRERALEVMRKGDVGPMGVVSLIIMLGLQAACLASLAKDWRGVALATALICCSRAAVTTCCMQGIPAARGDGLGASVAGTVPRWVVALVWVLVTGALTMIMIAMSYPWWIGALGSAAALIVVVVLLRRAIKRFGGITGDVIGAAVEVSLTALLIIAAAGS